MTDGASGWLTDEAARRGHEELELVRGRSGHLMVDAEIEGVAARLILDTGASRTCLDRRSAEGMGVRPGESEASLAACGAGAGGNVAMSFATVGSLRLSRVSVGPVDVGLLDLNGVNEKLRLTGDPPIDGILGGDLLKRHSAIVDLAAESLYLLP